MSPVLHFAHLIVLPLRGFSCYNAGRPPRVSPEARVGSSGCWKGGEEGAGLGPVGVKSTVLVAAGEPRPPHALCPMYAHPRACCWAIPGFVN